MRRTAGSCGQRPAKNTSSKGSGAEDSHGAPFPEAPEEELDGRAEAAVPFPRTESAAALLRAHRRPQPLKANRACADFVRVVCGTNNRQAGVGIHA